MKGCAMPSLTRDYNPLMPITSSRCPRTFAENAEGQVARLPLDHDRPEARPFAPERRADGEPAQSRGGRSRGRRTEGLATLQVSHCASSARPTHHVTLASSRRQVVYVGEGESLHLDLQLAHNRAESIMCGANNELARLAVKQLQVGVPHQALCVCKATAWPSFGISLPGRRYISLAGDISLWQEIMLKTAPQHLNDVPSNAISSPLRPASARCGSHLQLLVSQLHVPAGAFEGGNGVNDLPGTNDADPRCELITKEGIDEAGVVMVLLEKDLDSAKETKTLLKHVANRVLKSDNDKQRVIFLINRAPVLPSPCALASHPPSCLRAFS